MCKITDLGSCLTTSSLCHWSAVLRSRTLNICQPDNHTSFKSIAPHRLPDWILISFINHMINRFSMFKWPLGWTSALYEICSISHICAISIHSHHIICKELHHTYLVIIWVKRVDGILSTVQFCHEAHFVSCCLVKLQLQLGCAFQQLLHLKHAFQQLNTTE